MPISRHYRPSLAHAKLDERFYDRVNPASFPNHIIRWRNQLWAQKLGLDELTNAEWIEHFGRFAPLPDNHPSPLALRYHGHQFRHYNPDLGDGRGFLFAQMIEPLTAHVLDLGTKGSGQTPWSRFGDGRLTLKGGVREILATEMLEAYGVNTSKTLSLIETGEELARHDEPSPTRSSVLVRLSHSHIRIGTFQRLAYLRDNDAIETLINHVITYYMADLSTYEGAERIAQFYKRVIENVAHCCAQWMVSGFVHGVLNTDNINITGESFDYGPWRFVPYFDPNFTAAYFDENGLYAFGRQPQAVKWNLARLAECLLPFLTQEHVSELLAEFDHHLAQSYADHLFHHLGLIPHGNESDTHFIKLWTQFLHDTRVPFAQAHFDWHGGKMRHDSPCAPLYDSDAMKPLRKAFADYTKAPITPAGEAYFAQSTPCTMLIDDVEAIWDRIAKDDDWSAFDEKIKEIAAMKRALAPKTEDNTG